MLPRGRQEDKTEPVASVRPAVRTIKQAPSRWQGLDQTGFFFPHVSKEQKLLRSRSQEWNRFLFYDGSFELDSGIRHFHKFVDVLEALSRLVDSCLRILTFSTPTVKQPHASTALSSGRVLLIEALQLFVQFRMPGLQPVPRFKEELRRHGKEFRRIGRPIGVQ